MVGLQKGRQLQIRVIHLLKFFMVVLFAFPNHKKIQHSTNSVDIFPKINYSLMC